jgi:hypothetical protein
MPKAKDKMEGRKTKRRRQDVEDSGADEHSEDSAKAGLDEKSPAFTLAGNLEVHAMDEESIAASVATTGGTFIPPNNKVSRSGFSPLSTEMPWLSLSLSPSPSISIYIVRACVCENKKTKH